MRKLRKLLVWMVILAAGGTTVWCSFSSKGDPAEEAAYRAEKVDRGDIHLAVTATGTVSAVTTVQVGSQVSGIIARLYADFNNRVRKASYWPNSTPPISWPRWINAARTWPGPRSRPPTRR